MRIINGTYPFKFPLKAVNFKHEHRDFTHSWRLRNNNNNNNNNNNFHLNVTEWLASPDGTKFSKPTEEMSKEELNVFRKSFCTSAGNRDGTLTVLQKFINEIHLRAAIDRFLRSLPLNKPFSTISDPAFTEANKANKSPQKNRQHCRSNRAHKKRSETNFQWTDSKKLFDSGELGRAKSKIKIRQNYRGRPSFTSVSFLVDEDKRFNAGWRQQFCPCEKSIKELSILMSSKRRLESYNLPATKNHQGLGDSKDESDAKIFSVPDSETGQQSSPHIQLKLMRRQPQQGNADRVLAENNFDTTSVTWQSKFSAVLLQRYLPVYS